MAILSSLYACAHRFLVVSVSTVSGRSVTDTTDLALLDLGRSMDCGLTLCFFFEFGISMPGAPINPVHLGLSRINAGIIGPTTGTVSALAIYWRIPKGNISDQPGAPEY